MIFHYGKFFLSCLLAFTAGHITNYSVIMYCQDVLQSNLLSGLGFGLCFGPPIIFGWIAGVQCDRRPPTQIIHFASSIFLLSCFVFIATVSGVFPQVAGILSAAFLAGLGWSFVSPARMAALPQIVAARDLKKASLIFNVLVMLGFGLGPILISICRSRWGWAGVFTVDMIFFALSSLLLIGYKTKASSTHKTSVMKSVREGLQAVRQKPLIRDLLLSAVFGFMLMGPIQVILPKLSNQVLHLSELERGSFLGALAPSFILGGVLCMVLIRKVANGVLIFTSVFLAGIAFMSFSILSNVQSAVVVLVFVGTLGGIAMSTISTVLQENVSENVRGRVLAMYTIASQVMPAISGVIAGLMVHFFGVVTACIVCGAILSVSVIVNALWMKSLRTLK